jgi:hypothetical protein
VLAPAERPALVVTALIVLDAEDALDALCEVEALPALSA